MFENARLSDEIALTKQMKIQPLVELKQQLAELEQEIETKNSIILSFQDKVNSIFKHPLFFE